MINNPNEPDSSDDSDAPDSSDDSDAEVSDDEAAARYAAFSDKPPEFTNQEEMILQEINFDKALKKLFESEVAGNIIKGDIKVLGNGLPLEQLGKVPLKKIKYEFVDLDKNILYSIELTKISDTNISYITNFNGILKPPITIKSENLTTLMNDQIELLTKQKRAGAFDPPTIFDEIKQVGKNNDITTQDSRRTKIAELEKKRNAALEEMKKQYLDSRLGTQKNLEEPSKKLSELEKDLQEANEKNVSLREELTSTKQQVKDITVHLSEKEQKLKEVQEGADSKLSFIGKQLVFSKKETRELDKKLISSHAEKEKMHLLLQAEQKKTKALSDVEKQLKTALAELKAELATTKQKLVDSAKEKVPEKNEKLSIPQTTPSPPPMERKRSSNAIIQHDPKRRRSSTTSISEVTTARLKANLNSITANIQSTIASFLKEHPLEKKGFQRLVKSKEEKATYGILNKINTTLHDSIDPKELNIAITKLEAKLNTNPTGNYQSLKKLAILKELTTDLHRNFNKLKGSTQERRDDRLDTKELVKSPVYDQKKDEKQSRGPAKPSK